MAKAVKLSDIAERLGISTVSVSKALSDQKGVSEQMRLEIKRVASEMGYVSPGAARLSEEKKSYNIGVIVSHKYFNQKESFYWLMYQQLATSAISKNCFSVLEVVSPEDEEEMNVPKILDGDRINGLIILGSMKEEYLAMVKQNAKIPIVYLDFYEKDNSCDAVVTDNYFGMYQMTDYLCRMGHKKIAYVGTLFTTHSITDRYFGYCKALYENGIEVREDYVINDRFEETGEKEGYKFVLPSKEDMPTAFACNCDMTALELISSLNAMGYKVPEDISVVGFDDYSFQNGTKIGLTTYSVDVKEMVGTAIRILLRKMSGEVFEKPLTVVEGKVVIRDSVKKQVIKPDILFMAPAFKQQIWGGENLKNEWNYRVPGPKTGECWAISAHPTGDCSIKSGQYGGMKLSELWDSHRELFGNSEKDRFPLLVKIIDPQDDLSIQVHPDDEYAKEHENGAFGKTECWYVLDAPLGASLVLGHNASDREELADMINEKRWDELIREMPVKKGDFIQIEPGTVHAIKGGIQILETQQNSDITYRLYDYDRLSGGKLRDLHIKQSIDVIRIPTPWGIVKSVDNLPANQLNELISCSKFTVWKIDVDGKMSFEMNDKYMLMSVVEGSGSIDSVKIKKGDHFILPSGYGLTRLEGRMTIIASRE